MMIKIPQHSGSAAAVGRPLNRFLADRLFAVLSEGLEDGYAAIKRGRSGRGS
jgi:hypothetical protein